MRGLLVVLLAAGCARHVVHVEATPGATVTLNHATARGDRWSVAPDSSAQIVATWADGRQVSTTVVVDRDLRVLLRKDGDPARISDDRAQGLATPAASAGVAAPVAVPVANTPPAGDPMSQARSLAEAGQKAFELTDYDEAIGKFKAAYELIRGSQDPRAPEILGNILYNLAVVYERSYEVTPDPERLRRARVMYRQFDEQMTALVEGWDGSGEHADVQSRVRALDARLGGK